MGEYKYLYLVRHGKAVSGPKIVQDYDRTLVENGVSDNYKISKKIKLTINGPQLIISSSAIRALHTALIFARTFNYPPDKIRILEDLYLYTDDEAKIREIIRKIDNSVESVMLVGHNPAFTNLANYFLDKEIFDLPKSGVVYLKFAADSWDNIGSLKPAESFVDYP